MRKAQTPGFENRVIASGPSPLAASTLPTAGSLTSLTTIITASGTRYEIDEALPPVVVRRLAPVSGDDALADEWPDGTLKVADRVRIVDHPHTRKLGALALVIVTAEGKVITTSPIISLTDGAAD